jgi:hypothetical protein
MAALAGVAIGILVIASFAVAIRLLALYRRSGQLPELLLGTMLLLCVGLGYPLQIATTRVDEAAIRPLMIVSTIAIGLGFSCLYAFTWRVFRRESPIAAAAAIAGIACLVSTALWEAGRALLGGEMRRASDVSGASLVHASGVIAAYLWTAWESLRYHGIMKRRLKLGMADPVVCNRLLLWGLMGLAVAFGVSINLAAGLAGISIVESAGVLLASSCTGMAQTVLLVLAFAPPRGYTAWVRGAAPA